VLRALAILLIVANLLFLAWSRGWLDDAIGIRAGGDREPERLARQVRPDMVVLLPPSAASAPGAAACVEAGPFAEAEIAAARGVLEPILRPDRIAVVPADAAVSGALLLRVDQADEALAAQLIALRADALGRGFRRCGAAN
jgi:hypothetical protein